jgi:hypothetical protein
VSLGAGAVALAAPASADPLIGPTPVPTNTTTLTFTNSHDGLVPGQAINFHVDTTSPDTLNKVEAHICATGFTTYSGSQFGYSGASGTRCVYGGSGGISSGSLNGIQAGYKLGPLPYSAVTTSGPLSFAAGTTDAPGAPVSWFNSSSVAGNGGNPLSCDVTHKCDLVVDVGLTGDSNTLDTFFIQPLTFAGAPAAPAPALGTVGNGAVTINWPTLAAGIPSGNGTIDKYTVIATPHTPGSNGCPATGSTTNVTTGFGGVGTPVTATSANITGLTNFCQYDFTMTAETVASDGATHFTSPVGGPVSATPTQAGPATVSAAPGNHQVTLTISPVAGATDYQVQVSPVPGSGNCASGTCLTGGLTNFTVTGLTNGTPYTFTVAAVIGGNTTSGTVATATPNGTLITQTIDVVRPQGTLVISQYCSGFPGNSGLAPTDLNGNFDPSNNNGNDVPNAVPLTNCNLTLSGPRQDKLQNNAITASPRSTTDAVTNGTTTVTSGTIGFTANDVDQLVTGDGIPAGTRIASVTNGTTAVLTNAATISFSGGQLKILGTTVHFGAVSGNTITPDGSSALTGSDVGKEIEGFQIPGGSTITNVLNASTFDISQPADAASNGFSTREWLQAPTPAHLITAGPQAGQYFQATGQMRQVIVVDTRAGADTGWTATGQVTNFSDGVHTFSGDDLGWAPQGVHAFSQPFNTPDGPYSMAPAAGGLVNPGSVPGLHSGTSASTDTSVAGPIPGMTLAYANAGHGLGLAQLDANLTLNIPVFDVAGHYSAVLTLTAV